jgi:hypothetical protein
MGAAVEQWSCVADERELVSAMSKFTDQQRAEILRRAHETLEHRDEPPPAPRVSNEDSRRREAADAERKRQERDDGRARAQAAQADWNAWCDRRIAAALTEHNQKFAELARGSVEFSDAVCARLRQMETMLEQLSAKITELRAIDDQHRVIDMPSPLRPRSVN